MKIRNWIVRIRLLAVMAAAMCLLAGCGLYKATIDTQLKVNEDLSGVRVMDVTIPSGMVSGKTPVTLDILNRLVEKNCPQELTWSYVRNGNKDQYHVELAFDSLADYMMKVKVITGRSVKLEIETSDTVWAKGIRVSEDFTSADLLAWLTDALVSEGMAVSDAKSGIFREGSTTLVYGDRSYKTDFMIQADEMVSAPLEKIDVLTDIKSMDRFDRKFVIYAPTTSMEASGKELRTYLENMVPADAVSEWGLYGNGATLTISREDLSFSDLNEFSREVFALQDGGAVVSEAEPGADLFAFTNRWEEEMSLAAYGCENGETIGTGYYVKAENGIEISGAAEPSNVQAAEKNSDYDGYQLIRAERADRIAAEFGLARVYRIDHTNIRTTVKSGNTLEREIRLTLQETPDEAHREQIADRLRARSETAAGDGGAAGDADGAEAAAGDASGAGDEAAAGDADGADEKNDGRCEIRTEAGEDGFAVIISMKGEPLVITELSGRILGGTTEISWKTEGGLFRFRSQFAYAETADYSEFFADAAPGHTITYVIGFDGAGGSVAEPDETALKMLEAQGIARSADGKTVTLTIDGKSYQIEESGSALNVPGILLWVVIVLLIVIAVAAAVRFGVAQKVKEKTDIRQLQEKMDEKELRRATEAADLAEAKAREAAMLLAGQEPGAEEPQAESKPEEPQAEPDTAEPQPEEAQTKEAQTEPDTAEPKPEEPQAEPDAAEAQPEEKPAEENAKTDGSAAGQ